ncbi:SMP-30/gluconolactonase/LRE family protein [Sphingomicrobium aestuariivivum]|uniref:SMP-30/gluconolactonase/LRE family protein n=1 Tax=Sphingomicrobium aestuariivivum TaxID=1582356 RepID=UPI001FD70751|nr:hypothetical protein [Sphingomicrobium aestuariivivum]MCJ8190103.1 hypothetical protein [Sphingomicrobium aestuariivivum]
MIDPISWAPSGLFRAGLLSSCLALASCSTPGPVTYASDDRPPAERFADYPDWAASGEAGKVGDLAGLQALPDRYPNSASVQRRILGAAFAAGDRDAAQAALVRLGDMDYVLSDGALGQLGPFLGEAAVSAYRAGVEVAGTPRTPSTLAATIPADFPLSESVARDEATGRFYSLSVAAQQLIASDDGATWRALPVDLPGRPMGIAIDHDARRLWVSFGRLGEEDEAFVGLAAYDLDSGRELARHAVPDAASLNDLTVARDGSVLASDSLGGGVYRLATGGAAIARVDVPGTFRSPQGIAVHPQGGFAYVSDYSYGIAILELATGVAKRLLAVDSQMLDGVDGLFFDDRLGLVAIQNGVRPHRIMILNLRTDGGAVTQLLVPERAHPDWGEPTTGQYRGGELLYIANPQWERFGEGGMVDGDEPLEPNHVRRLNL